MIDLKELNKLLDKATPGEWREFRTSTGEIEYVAISSDWSKSGYKFCISQAVWNCRNEDIKLICDLHNNAKELLRLAEIGKRVEEFAGNKKDHDDYMSKMAEFFNKSGARL